MTLSPKTLTSIAPLDICTNLVKISRMGLDLALTSIAHIPKITGGLLSKVVASEWDPIEDGDEDRVRTEAERGDTRSGEFKKGPRRDCLSHIILAIRIHYKSGPNTV